MRSLKERYNLKSPSEDESELKCLVGDWRGGKLGIRLEYVEKDDYYVSIIFETPTPIGAKMEANVALGLLDSMKSVESVKTGDDEFDDAMRVTGSPSMALAHLSSSARQALLPIAKAGLLIQPDLMRYRHQSTSITFDEAVELIERIGGVVSAMRFDLDPLDRLVLIAQHDPLIVVRSRALEALSTEHAHSRQADQAQRAALAGPSLILGLEAARYLGARDPQASIDYLSGLLDQSHPVALMLRALRILETIAPNHPLIDAHLDVLRTGLKLNTDDARWARAALEARVGAGRGDLEIVQVADAQGGLELASQNEPSLSEHEALLLQEYRARSS
jgi:hypothetical protein